MKNTNVSATALVKKSATALAAVAAISTTACDLRIDSGTLNYEAATNDSGDISLGIGGLITFMDLHSDDDTLGGISNNASDIWSEPDRYLGRPEDITDWQGRFFHPQEFASRGNGEVNVEARMVRTLDSVRSEFGYPITITSGYRDPAHNAMVGGATNSQHMHGIAVDIDLGNMDSDTRYILMMLLIRHGFTSFGSYSRHPDMLHADMRERAATWHHGAGRHPEWFLRALSDSGWQQGVGITR